MKPLGRFEKTLLGVNTLGLLAYLFWLVFRAGPFMYSQEGVLYFLPCLPFFFIYVSILGNRKEPEDE